MDEPSYYDAPTVNLQGQFIGSEATLHLYSCKYEIMNSLQKRMIPLKQSCQVVEKNCGVSQENKFISSLIEGNFEVLLIRITFKETCRTE